MPLKAPKRKIIPKTPIFPKKKPDVNARIEAHNQDPDAHPELNSILALDERLTTIEDNVSLLSLAETPTSPITIYAQNVYIGYNGSVDIQPFGLEPSRAKPYPRPEFPEFEDIQEDELEQYGIKKACPERSRRTRRRKAYKLLSIHKSLTTDNGPWTTDYQEKIDYGVAAVDAPNAWKETKGGGGYRYDP